MQWWLAAEWGLLGGFAAGLAAMMTAVVTAGFAWPWKRDEVGPRLFVFGGSLVLGALDSDRRGGRRGWWP